MEVSVLLIAFVKFSLAIFLSCGLKAEIILTSFSGIVSSVGVAILLDCKSFDRSAVSTLNVAVFFLRTTLFFFFEFDFLAFFLLLLDFTGFFFLLVPTFLLAAILAFVFLFCWLLPAVKKQKIQMNKKLYFKKYFIMFYLIVGVSVSSFNF